MYKLRDKVFFNQSFFLVSRVKGWVHVELSEEQQESGSGYIGTL